MISAARWLRDRSRSLLWALSGRRPPVPPSRKREIVLDHARRFGLRFLVETGTYLGDMVEDTKHHFSKVVSIELDEELHARARSRFSGDGNVELLQGDSGRLLREVLRQLENPALFWLDAHYSEGETARGSLDSPVVAEVKAILELGTDEDVILIDDARLFGDPSSGYSGYPSVPQLQEIVRSQQPAWQVLVEDDVIRIHADVDRSSNR